MKLLILVLIIRRCTKKCYLSSHLFLYVSKGGKFRFSLEYNIYAEGEELKHHNYF